MQIFLTGATGFIGSAIIPELLGAGHSVLGLTRSDAGAATLVAAGATVHRGDIQDLESLRSGAAQADGVIHTAFDHDFTNFSANCEKDRRAISALGAALGGSERPLVITSSTGMGNGAPGQLATEDRFDPDHPNPRTASERAGASMLAAGVNVSVVRLPQVHNTVKQGLVTSFIALARQTGVSAYLGDGTNRMSAGHVLDVARLYRLAFERGEPGARYHAVAEEGIALREIADAIGAGLGVPAVSLPEEDADAHFGWLARFAGADLAASSAQTRTTLSWQPTGPGLLADLAAMDYAA